MERVLEKAVEYEGVEMKVLERDGEANAIGGRERDEMRNGGLGFWEGRGICVCIYCVVEVGKGKSAAGR